MVRDGHALKVELLEPRVGGGEGGAPGQEVGTPVEGHQIEVGEAGLALDGDGADAAEAGGGAAGGDGVAVADEEVGSGEGLGSVP